MRLLIEELENGDLQTEIKGSFRDVIAAIAMTMSKHTNFEVAVKRAVELFDYEKQLSEKERSAEQ